MEKNKGEKEVQIMLLAAVVGGDPEGLHSVQNRDSAKHEELLLNLA